MRYLLNVTSLKFYEENCTGCRRCVEVCPHNVFQMNNKKAYITGRDQCMECGACQKNCAFDAIFVHAGVGCSAAIINGMITGGEPSCGCGDTETCC